MSLLKLLFAGEIKKIEMRQVGARSLAEVSVCKKNRTKEGDEESYTWANITIWGPFPDWMGPKLVKGAMIAGSGDATLRSYLKDGVKRQSLDVNCQSMDVEVSGGAPREAQHEPTQRAEPRVDNKMTPSKPTWKDSSIGSDEPPFAPLGYWG